MCKLYQDIDLINKVNSKVSLSFSIFHQILPSFHYFPKCPPVNPLLSNYMLYLKIYMFNSTASSQLSVLFELLYGQVISFFSQWGVSEFFPSKHFLVFSIVDIYTCIGVDIWPPKVGLPITNPQQRCIKEETSALVLCSAFKLSTTTPAFDMPWLW